MPEENIGQQTINANQRKAQDVKSQDTINNERIIQQMENEKIRKEQGEEQKKEWIEKEKEQQRKQSETLNQREFFLQLQQGLKDKNIGPDITIPWEEVPEYSQEEIANMDDHSFSLWVERNQFARELADIRIAQQKREIANAIADDIETERKSSWEKRTELMTDSERLEFNRKFATELTELDKQEE